MMLHIFFLSPLLFKSNEDVQMSQSFVPFKTFGMYDVLSALRIFFMNVEDREYEAMGWP